MNSDMTQGVSRRSFLRIVGAASAAATSFPAFAAMTAGCTCRPGCDDEVGSAGGCSRFRLTLSSSARMRIRWDRRSPR